MNPLMKNIFRKIIQKFSLMNFTTFITFFPHYILKTLKVSHYILRQVGGRREYFVNKIEKLFETKSVYQNITVILFPKFVILSKPVDLLFRY